MGLARMAAREAARAARRNQQLQREREFQRLRQQHYRPQRDLRETWPAQPPLTTKPDEGLDPGCAWLLVAFVVIAAGIGVMIALVPRHVLGQIAIYGGGSVLLVCQFFWYVARSHRNRGLKPPWEK